MRKITKLLMLMLLSVITLAACTKDDQNTLVPSTGELVTSLSQIVMSESGGDATFTVTGGTAFVRSNNDWITVQRTAGDSKSSTFLVTCSENTGSAERIGSIVANLNGAYKNIEVKQAGKVVVPPSSELHTFRSASEIAVEMYPGWNLGNTLEACSSDNMFNNKAGVNMSGWQPTATTREVIDAVKAAGFRSVRIPCSFIAGHVKSGDAKNFTIDPEWLKAVKNVIDWCVADGLYVVINDHWDGGWLEVEGFTSNRNSFSAVDDDYVNDKITTLTCLWKQVATALKDYDEHVLFAGLNEPFQEYGLFNSRHQALTPVLVKYNKAFVDAVRSTGGNNASRVLVVQGPGTNIASTCNYLSVATLPETAGKLMVEVHFYDPGQFCGTFDNTGDKAFYYWGAANHSSNHNASWAEESYVKEQFGNLSKTFTSKGFPVIIGEYAAMQRKMPAGQDQTKHDASVKLFYQVVNQTAVDNGIITFAWDTNDVAGLSKESGSGTIIDRAKKTVVGTNALEGIKAGVAAGKWMGK